jgi:hypothetical protein
MSEPSGVFAVPYRMDIGGPEKSHRIIQHMVTHRLWFAGGLSEDEARMHAIELLADSSVWKWEIWRGGEFLGMIMLHRIAPCLDAVFHFTLFNGGNLVSVRRLLKNFVAFAFDAFKLQRISAEVPENGEKFMRFLRSNLGFRLEGELSCTTSRLAEFLASKKTSGIGGAASREDAGVWLAKYGSRREKAHFDGARFRDVYLLRLLKTEHEAAALPGAEPRVAREQLGSPDNEFRTETGSLRTSCTA